MRWFFLISFTFMVSSCVVMTYEDTITQQQNPHQYLARPIYPVTLQNPYSRMIVRCGNSDISYEKNQFEYKYARAEIEKCAYRFESQGFVRINYNSIITADRDFPLDGSYPTRRWRDNELVSRW